MEVDVEDNESVELKSVVGLEEERILLIYNL